MPTTADGVRSQLSEQSPALAGAPSGPSTLLPSLDILSPGRTGAWPDAWRPAIIVRRPGGILRSVSPAVASPRPPGVSSPAHAPRLRRPQDRRRLQADLRRRGAQAPAHRAPQRPPRARGHASHPERRALLPRAARHGAQEQALDRRRQVHDEVGPAVRRRDAGPPGRRLREARRLQRQQGLCHAARARPTSTPSSATSWA